MENLPNIVAQVLKEEDDPIIKQLVQILLTVVVSKPGDNYPQIRKALDEGFSKICEDLKTQQGGILL